MSSVNFLYRSKKPRAFLTVRFLHRLNAAQKKDLVIAAKTRIEVSKEYWEKHHTNRVKDAFVRKLQMEVTQKTNDLEIHILNAFRDSDPQNIDKQWLQATIDLFYEPKKAVVIPKDLVNFIDYYIGEREHELGVASIRKFRVIKHKMERLVDKRGRPILISEINDSFQKELAEYYQEEEYSMNTAHKELSIIKSFCKYAQRKGLEVHPELFDLKIKKVSMTPVYLNFKEIEMIEQLTLKRDTLKTARDWLVISCYTGQRISDFMNFHRGMIRVEKGKKLLEFKQKKTKKQMTIPLHPEVQKVLKKRKGEFPEKQTDQKYNIYIKEICKLAGIDQKVDGKKIVNVKGVPKKNSFRRKAGQYSKYELVSSHIGRRSFATNFYGKIPTSYLIYVTGHSSEAMFLNYIGKSNKDLAIELTNYF